MGPKLSAHLIPGHAMDFDLSDEQRLLKDSVDRLIADRYGFTARQGYRAQPEGWSRDIWAQMADMGLLGLPFAEADGGFGGGPVEMALVMEALGRSLVVEPYFPTIVLCGALLRLSASPAQRARLVPQITAGTLILAYAQVERQSRYSLNDVTTRAVLDNGAWRLSGAKTLVLAGDSADALLVTARTAGNERDRHGALERAQDEALAALAAEAVGVMQVMHDMTVDYLKTRKQFGRAIGENQSLQHRAVEMYVYLEQARSMSFFATMMALEDDDAERQRAMHAAKVQIGRSGRHIGQEAVQLHGGIGVTMEYSVGHYFKRMTTIERSFGDTATHLAALARLGGLIAA
jgi:alkylation response protein AidB-like acyl-CoA dehydrogenase